MQMRGILTTSITNATRLLSAGAFFAFFLLVNTTSDAKTFQHWHCKCTFQEPVDVGDHCTCSGYSYTLGIFATKEFRATCDPPKVQTSRGLVDYTDTYLVVHSGGQILSTPNAFVQDNAQIPRRSTNKHLTCTTGVGTSGYTSKSCTNWRTGGKNTVRFDIKCPLMWKN